MRQWKYFLNGEHIGPVNEDKLIKMLLEGELPRTITVWTEGMFTWKMIEATPLAEKLALPVVVPQETPPINAVTASYNGNSPPQAPIPPIQEPMNISAPIPASAIQNPSVTVPISLTPSPVMETAPPALPSDYSAIPNFSATLPIPLIPLEAAATTPPGYLQQPAPTIQPLPGLPPVAPPVTDAANPFAFPNPVSFPVESRPVVTFFPTSILKFVLMSLMTFGIYEFYWFYKCWKKVKEIEGVKLSPFWRAFFMPIYAYFLFGKVKETANQVGFQCDYSPGWLTIGFIFCNLLSRLPDIFGLLSLAGIAIFIPVLKSMIQISKATTPPTLINSRFTGWNIVMIVFGSIFWLLILLSYVLPEMAV